MFFVFIEKSRIGWKGWAESERPHLGRLGVDVRSVRRFGSLNVVGIQLGCELRAAALASHRKQFFVSFCSHQIMEPVTYFVTYGTAMAAYAYFVLTKQVRHDPAQLAD